MSMTMNTTRRAIGFVVLASLASSACASRRVALPPQVSESSAVVWVGIDYTAAKFLGVAAFRNPAEIFPGYLKKWNALFVEELVPTLSSAVDKPVLIDADFVLSHNERASAAQIVETFAGARSFRNEAVSPATLASLVQTYRLNEASGVALVFIVDTLGKSDESACLYPTFFDIDSRAVLSSERLCYTASGFGFRNFWFNPIKEAVRHL